MRPEIINTSLTGDKIENDISIKKVIILFSVIVIFVGGIFSFFASQNPDGLEWSIEKTAGTAKLETNGKIHNSLKKIQQNTSVLPDYDFKSEDGDGTGIAGIVGSVGTFLLVFLAGGTISGAMSIHWTQKVELFYRVINM